MNKKVNHFIKILIFIYFIQKLKIEEEQKKIQKTNHFEVEINFDNIISSINAKDYVNKIINGIEIFNRTYNITNDPKLSVVIPIYNKENIIKRTIRSIQNQNMDNFEIILVNDYSSDNTLSVIKNIQNFDSRIKIIQNKNNMGTLYSRCIGTLSAKGKYILPLDNDDMYLYQNAFDDIYNEINNNNLDMIKFNGIEAENIEGFFNNKIKNVKFAFKKDHNIIINQPNLSYYPTIRLNNEGKNFAVDLFLWLKCIDSKLYKKVISIYSKERYSIYMTSCEDDIMTFMIFQFAESFKYINKYCILHFDFPGSANKLISNESRVISNMHYLDTVCEFSKNTYKGKEIILGIVLNIMKFSSFINVVNIIKYRKFFNDILNKIYSSKYIIEADKTLIKTKYYKLIHNSNYFRSFIN